MATQGATTLARLQQGSTHDDPRLRSTLPHYALGPARDRALDATLCMVGVPPNPQQIAAFSLILPRRNLAGSCIGGIREAQEMLDWCGQHGVACDIELIRMDQINEAYERMLRQDVRYRFVIDMQSLRA